QQVPPGYGQPPAPGYPPMQPAGGYPGYPAGYGGAAPGYGQPNVEGAFAGPSGAAPPAGFPGVNTQGYPEPSPDVPMIQTESPPQPPSGPAPEPEAPSASQPPPAEEKKEPRIVRIPCPQGHELQTPMDMVNQEVLCPICATQFHLRYEDSVEFKQEQAELRRRKAEQLNTAALKWSIIAAAVVVVGILGMIIYLVARAP